MGKSRGRGTRGHRPAQEEIDAAAGVGSAEDSSSDEDDEPVRRGAFRPTTLLSRSQVPCDCVSH
jgi:hypothetical protein